MSIWKGFCVLLVAVLATIPVLAQTYESATIIPLGDLTGGSFVSDANEVSADGAVVVGLGRSASGPEAFRWAGGVMTGLGVLSGGFFYSEAHSVSADGTVIVGDSWNGTREAFRWTGGVMTGLGDLPGGNIFSRATDVSADGAVVIGFSNGVSGTEAFRWTGGVMTGLGDLPGGFYYSEAHGVSADGAVVVGESRSASGNEAFRWTGGVMTGLGDLAGGAFFSRVRGVSADGAVVVGWSVSASGTEAFRWTGGVMTGLGDLAGGDFSSGAYAVSADGTVVVGRASSAAGSKAFIWTEEEGMQSLDDLLISLNALPAGWTLNIARGVSDDGLNIVGAGNFGSGFEAFLVQLVPATIDEVLAPAEVAKLLASDGAAGDRFGANISVDGNTAVISALFGDGPVADTGAAYVFKRDGGDWTEQAKLTASDTALNDRFGREVAVDGDTAVVGARENDAAGPASGAAYVFTRNGGAWTQQAKLFASDTAPGDFFGGSVALNGDTAVIGAQRDDPAGRRSGSTYVFTRNGGVWSEQAKLTASDGAPNDLFGQVVDVDGDTAVISARGDDRVISDLGSAYVFTRSGDIWTEQAKLTASDAAEGDVFGSVAIAGDTIVVGAEGNDDAGTSSGSAYVFTRSGGVWTEQAKLTASDAAEGDFFGQSVVVDGDTAVISARGDSDAGLNSGAAYVFIRNGTVWTEHAKLTASDADEGDRFGSLAVDGDTAIIGAQRDEEAGFDSGSAYVFSIGLDSDGDGEADSLDNCPSVFNPDQTDTSNPPDGTGDACVDPTVTIPPNADVDPTATIGSGTQVDTGVSVAADADIGSDVMLDQNVLVGVGATVGDGTEVDKNTSIGDGSSVGSGVSLAQGVYVGPGAIIADGVTIGRDSVICDGAMIGANAILNRDVFVEINGNVPAGTTIPKNTVVVGAGACVVP